MKKAVIYPFTLKQEYLVEHRKKMDDIELLGKVLPISWRASVFDKDDNLSEKIITKSEWLDKSDIVFVPEFELFHQEYSKTVEKNLKILEKENRVIIRAKTTENEIKAYEKPNKLWTNLNVPLIYVGEVKDGPYGAILTENIAEELRKNGYKVSAIINDRFAEWIGEKITPDFLRWDICAENKILMLNNFIKEIEDKEKPDVMVVQVQGNAVRLNNFSETNFEINSYIYSQAHAPDIYIQTIPINMYNDYLNDKIKKNCLNRFGFEIDILFVTNCYVDCSRVRFLGDIKEFYIGKNRALDKIKKMDLPANKFNCCNDYYAGNIVAYIKNKLGV